MLIRVINRNKKKKRTKRNGDKHKRHYLSIAFYYNAFSFLIVCLLLSIVCKDVPFDFPSNEQLKEGKRRKQNGKMIREQYL